MGLSQAELSAEEQATLLGMLANLLIDLDLPRCANVAIELHDDCVIENESIRQLQDFRRLDLQSRNSARRGDLDLGIRFMRRKQSLAQPNDVRERSWLLYLLSWRAALDGAFNAAADELARTIKRELTESRGVEVGHGNETAAYQLRALAAHGWLLKDEASKEAVAAWTDVTEERLNSADPGPWGYVLAYQYLGGAVRYSVFQHAVEALEHGRYFLEASRFFALARDESAAKRVLSRFQARRVRTMSELAKIDVPTLVPLKELLLPESDQRRICEGRRIESAADLCREGTMPL
jgi:hypothetical protein